MTEKGFGRGVDIGVKTLATLSDGTALGEAIQSE